MVHVPSRPRRFLLFLPALLTAASVASAEPLSVRDDLGRTLRFDSPPQRIVSLSPGVTEILFLLGLDDAVVGVSDFCNYPAAALSKPRAGGVNPNIEAIVALRPDLVVSTGGVGMRETARRMDRLGIPFLGVEADSVEAVLARIAMFGEITGRRDAAAAAVDALRTRLSAVSARRGSVPPVRVLYLIDENPYLTIGPKSFLYDVLVQAGGRPFETGPAESYPRVGLEPILRFDPEVIFFTGETEQVPEERIAAWHRWDRISAVKTGRLYSVPRDLVNRPGPRIIDAIEFFASKLSVLHEESISPP
jgi:iron complex transport system substrate-binding protein